MCIVAHGWTHGALWCAKGRRRVLCSSQHVFFMSQGEGWEPGFRFQVPRYFVPLSQGDEEQISGGGMFPRSPLIALFYYIPPPLRLTQRRTGECSPHRAQNDIQSFL